MSELPKQWERLSLVDAGMQAQTGFASGAHNRTGGGVIHLRPMNITRSGVLDLADVKYVEDDTDRRVQFGDVLFNNTNSPALVGKTALVTVTEPLAFSNHMTRLRFPANRVDPHFMAHQLQYLWAVGYFKEICSNHVNQASVATKRLGAVEVVLPPLDVQQRIVAILEDHLSRLDAGCIALSTLITRSSAWKRSLLMALLATTEQPSAAAERSPVHRVTALGEVADVINGDRGKNYPSRDAYVNKGIPFVNAGHLTDGRVSLEAMNYISEDCFALLSNGKLQAGDLLFCLRGSLGKVAVVDNIDKGAIASSLAIVRPKNGVSSQYLLLYLQSDLAAAEIRRYDNGTAQPNLSAADLRKFRVPVPAVEEQARIVSAFATSSDNCSRAVDQCHHALRLADSLRRSLLTAAFSGQLSKERSLV